MKTPVYSPEHLNLLVDQHCYGLTLMPDGSMMDGEGNIVREPNERFRHDIRIGTWECVDKLRQFGIDADIRYDLDKVIEI